MTLPYRWIAAWALVLACAPGRAGPLATEAALDALFSTNAAQVQGAPAPEPPAGFAGAEAEESELIAFLALQRKRGADLNAYRHLGTPLHHAIRAGMTHTALWLLNNGGNPMLRTAGEGDKLDALGVAIHTGAWDVFDVLARLPVYAALPPSERASRYWPQAMTGGERATALLQRRFALPRFDSSPETFRALLLHSLCTGQLSVARALLEAEPLARPIPDWQHACPRSDSSAPATPTPLPLAEWRALEQRLQWPMLPYLLLQARTPAQLRDALGGGLREPWDDPAVTCHVLRRVLLSDPQQSVTVLHAIPSIALKTALQDEALLRLWLQRSAMLAPAELDWALSQVEPQRVTQQLPHILSTWNHSAATQRDAKDRAGRLAHWSTLTRRLVAPLPATPGGVFAYAVPIELWPQWFALGLRMPDEDWASWLLWAPVAQVKEAWPALAKYQPLVAQRALGWLVAPLSVGPIDDAVAQRHSYGGGSGYWSQAQVENLLFLHSQGVRVPQPRWLAAGFSSPESLRVLEPLLRLGLVKVAPPALRNQVVRQPLQCKPSTSPALRRALADGTGLDRLQALARPGHAQCVWLATGGEGGGRRLIEDEDFLTGVQRLTPCADGNMTASVWQEESRRWADLKEAPLDGWIAVHVPALKQGGLLTFGVEQGTCGNRQGALFQAHFRDNGALEVVALGSGHPLFDALVLQCDFSNVEECPGLRGTTSKDEAGFAANAFADHFWANDKKSFFAALDALDRAALQRVRDDGLFPHWLDEAAQRVGASAALSLTEKRRRMAWLLAQRPLLRGLSNITLEALTGWLPAEDWGPIADSLRCTQRYLMQEAQHRAQERKLPALEQRLRIALALPCV